MRQSHGPFAYHPRRPSRVPSALSFLLVGMIAVLLSLMAGHVVVKAIANFAAHNLENTNDH
jgi:hypothetical protein